MTPASRQVLKYLDNLDMFSGYAIPSIACLFCVFELVEAMVP